MRRFWDTAGIAARDGGYAILLDGKPMRLPGGAALIVPGEALARAIADEWQAAGGARGGEMSFADTPLTRLAGTAQERVGADPAPVIDAIARYGASDLLCYRAEAPEALARRQMRLWQPWLDWAALAHDAPLRVGAGVVFVEQDPQALAALRAAVAACPVPVLAALGIAVPATGSLILGLALAAGRMDAAQAASLSMLDETFQAELWGEDAEATTRRQAVAADITLAARFMELVRPGALPPRSASPPKPAKG